MLWRRLRAEPFSQSHFRRQATIGPYFADFASHRLRLVIELDGGQHLDSARDLVRTDYLERAGYRVLRFWNHDVLSNIEGVLSAVAQASGHVDRPPPPTPPRRERGEG